MDKLAETKNNSLSVSESSRVFSSAITVSYAQRNIWISDQLKEKQTPYNQCIAWRITGDINRKLFKEAVYAVIKKHDVLNSFFVEVDNEIVQCIKENEPLNIKFVDYSMSEYPQELLQTYVKSESDLKFDLTAELPIRLHLILLSGDNDFVFLMTVHKIVWDRNSSNIFISELTNIYLSKLNSIDTDNPHPSVTYFDFVYGQKKTVLSNNIEEKITYWQQELSQAPSLHCLPLDKPRTAEQSFNSERFVKKISSELYKNVLKLSEDLDVRLFVVLQSVFALLIARWSNSSDVLVGTVKDCRDIYGFTDVLGNCENNIVYRTNIPGNVCYREYLNLAKIKDASHLANSEVPFEVLWDRIQPERSLSHAPIFQIAFNLEKKEQRSGNIPGVSMQPIEIPAHSALYDIELTAVTNEQGLELNWLYASDLFKIDSIESLATSFEVLLANIVRNPDEKIYSLSLLTPLDKHQLKDWCQNKVRNNVKETINQVFKKQVLKSPEAIALVKGKEVLTYGSLERRIAAFTFHLLEMNVEPGQKIGIYSEPSFDMIAAVFAILRVSAVYVPLDINYPSERVKLILNESNTEYVFSDFEQFQENYGVNAVYMEAIDDLITQSEYDNIELRLDTKPSNLLDEAAYLIYTSGSTGVPKGIVGQQRGLLNRFYWMKKTYPYDSEDIFCFKTPTSCVDHFSEIFQPLLSGNRLVVIPEIVRSNFNLMLDLLGEEEVNIITLLPSMLRDIAMHCDADKLSKLRFLICSGEILSQSLVEIFRAKFPKVKIINLYGLSESGADTICYNVGGQSYAEVATYFSESKKSVHFKDTGLNTSSNSSLESLDTIKKKFSDSDLPNIGWSLDRYLSFIKREVIPSTAPVTSRTYIGHMTSALPTFMSEFSHLISELNQNVVKVETSKSTTFIERQVLAMLHKLFYAYSPGFYDSSCQDPQHIFGVVTSGGSLSNLTALWCARNTALIKKGVSKEDLSLEGANKTGVESGYSGCVIIGSRLMHYSMRKIASVFGIGEKNIRYIPQLSNQKISKTELDEYVQEVLTEGKFVIAIVGIAGATETGTIDPLIDMAKVAEKYGVHFHVDAAWGGAVQFSEKYRYKIAGIERADSITICSHKQLYTPQGLSLCLFKDTQLAKNIAVYANYQAMPGSFDLGQFSIEGSRSANSMLLHAGLHLLAVNGYANLVEQGIEKTQSFIKLIKAYDSFELVGLPELNIVNYRYIPSYLLDTDRKYSKEENDLINKAVISLQKSQFSLGKTFVSKTKVLYSGFSDEPIWVFRVVISNPLTSVDDLHEVLKDQMSIGKRIFGNQDIKLLTRGFYSKGEIFSSGFDQRAIPIGKPIHDTSVFILDEYLNQVPVGGVGELCIGGVGLAKGTFGANNKANSNFIQFKISDTDYIKLHKTGDFGRWRPDGNIEFLGRKDNQVKIRGYRVEIVEIEQALNKMPGVVDSAVLVRTSEDGSKFLSANIKVLNDKFDEEILCLRLREVLPSYMVPSRFFCSNLPVTRSGKINREELSKDIYFVENDTDNKVNLSSTKLECELVKLWAEVLKIPVSQVFMDSEFFELGGNSLMIVKLKTLYEKLGLTVTVSQLFHNSTIRQLSNLVEYSEKTVGRSDN